MREAIYKEFMENPRKNNVRVLAQRYHLSIKRVDAILRLKGLEANWVEVSPHFLNLLLHDAIND
jgi:hypothetical protein